MKIADNGLLAYGVFDCIGLLFIPIGFKRVQQDFLENIDINDRGQVKMLEDGKNQAIDKAEKYSKYNREIEKIWFMHNKEVLRNWAVVLASISIIISVLIRLF